MSGELIYVPTQVRDQLLEIAEMWAVTKPHWRKSTYNLNNLRGHIKIAHYGLIGEWVVGKVLGIQPDVSIHPGDGGIDMIYANTSLQIKGSWHYGGYLIFGGNWNKAFVANKAVMVFATNSPDHFRIAGWIDRSDFAERHERTDFGYGPRDAIHESCLHPFPRSTDGELVKEAIIKYGLKVIERR